MKKRYIFGIIFLFLAVAAVFHVYKPLPAGVDYSGELRAVPSDDVRFLYDLTYEKNGARIHEQHIFDRIFCHIREAEKYILIDMFLFNSFLGNSGSAYRSLSGELTEQLIDARKRNPDIKVDVITDPINTVYGGAASPQLQTLKEHGINVIITDLKPLRDSNPLYSSLWRTFIGWFGNSQGGWLPHPFSAEASDVSLRSYLNLINFKANHRKIFMADSGRSYVSVIMSANPHDASSSHSNAALEIRGDTALDLYETETGIASFCRGRLSQLKMIEAPDEGKGLNVRLMTEDAIFREVIKEISGTASGDGIDIAMFYLSERNVVNSLAAAAGRGANIRIILDPNKDAFGYKKAGIPNRPVAGELLKRTDNRVRVRWYNTMGEQFHSKVLLIRQGKESTIILGSANLTRRNLRNYNLELDVVVKGESKNPVFREAESWFDRIWNNRDGSYTVDYNAFQDNSFLKTLIYYIQERTGMCSF